MTDFPSLSRRGARAAATPLRIDHAAFREATRHRYHPTENPRGALALSIAENRLSWHELRAKIEEVSGDLNIPDWVAKYTAARGSHPFRQAAAAFLSEHLTGCPVDGEHLAVSAGATSVIEMTSFLLADAGDVAVIPAPCYPVYRQDLGNISGVERYDLVTHHEPSEIARGPALTVAHLDEARRTLDASGRNFRILILTAPDNPTGGIYPRALMEEIADWCIAAGVHLVVNEIYGLSLIDVTHPDLVGDYVDPEPFTSFARIMETKASDYLHLWYALSKDLGISGFRLGMLHTRNVGLLEAYENFNLSHSTSNHTQWLMQHVLSDTPFMTEYIARNQERLTASYALAVRHLRRLGIPYVPSRGSLFAWVDLSEFLRGDGEADEIALWQEIFLEAGVLFTPGVGFGHSKRGLFRVVYPAVSPDELEVAMQRLGTWVEGRRHG